MKGKLLLSAMLMSSLVASNAVASIARQAVFGTQPLFTSASGTATTGAVTGSLWFDDDYNVFYNPSYVMDNKNMVSINKGLEGGYFQGFMENFAYGLYFNRGAGAPGATYGGGQFVAPGLNQQAAFANGNALDTQRPIDLFIAGDTGIKWGFHATWAYRRNQSVATFARQDAEATARYWHFDLGAQVMGFEPFIGATLFSKYQDNTVPTTITQDLNEFNAGVRYKYEGWTPYAVFKKYRENGNFTNVAYTDVGATGLAGTGRQAQTRMNVWGVGVGHDTKVADGVHVMKHIAFFQNSVEDDTGVTANLRDHKDTVVPINVSVEAEATSWLVLRAGVDYHLINERETARTTISTTNSVNDKVVSQTGTTTFRIGSTFKFGKLHLDSAFGNGAVGAASLDATNNVGFDSQTFALLSAAYHW